MRIYSVNVDKEGESEIETENRAKVNTRWTAKAARVVHVDCGQMCPPTWDAAKLRQAKDLSSGVYP